ncbi:FAD binding domain protein, partial [Macrophomina phaseolina]
VPAVLPFADQQRYRQCSALTLRCGERCAQPGTEAYNSFRTEFWSLQQGNVRPACVFKPTSATEVSVAVQLARLLQCPFAVKSGGHATFAGASNIPDGITIDFKLMNAITLSPERDQASIGPGNTWFDVYTALEPEGLAVIGGRVAEIGVGGLTLGGGISFFSGLYGWACDNVVEFEVVTANGSIVNVSPEAEPDLYWALRGGGNNFGIVTRFTLSTFPQGLMWGGGRIHTFEQKDGLVSAFTNFGFNAPQDPKAAVILSIGHVQGMYLAASDLQYADPVADPPILENFTAAAIPNVLQDSTSVRTLPNLTQYFNALNPNGLRQTYWTAAYKNNADLTSFIFDTFIEEVDPIQNITALLPAVSLQFITTPMMARMKERGGNALGLEDEKEPLVLVNVNVMWREEADDKAVLSAAANTVRKVNEKAKSVNLHHEFEYMNYASQYQDPVSSYGAENNARLLAIAEKYDPEGVFQKLQPGYFKLDHAPKSPWPGR